MLNKVILMGRLVADPEFRTTQSGVSFVSFRIAVDRNYTPKGAERQADFIPCVAWRQTAEFINRYFSKGRMIALEGSLQSRNYEDKTGARRTAYEVMVDQAYFADGKPDGAAAPASPPAAESAAQPAAMPASAPPPVPAGDPAAAYVQAAQYGLPGNVHYRGTLDVDFAEDDPYSGDLPF